jgi:hypothetical protein
MRKRKHAEVESDLAKSQKKQRVTEPAAATSITETKPQPKYRIQKLAPTRPFPTVHPADSATGPKSAYKEGKNYIAVTRKTALAAYLRRCRELLVGKDGYTYIVLHALGAAVPHLLLLTTSLSAILPFPKDEIHTEVRTESIELVDEVIPLDDEEEESTFRVRGKSGLRVVLWIGKEPPDRKILTGDTGTTPSKKKKRKPKVAKPPPPTGTAAKKSAAPAASSKDDEMDEDGEGEVIVFEEGEQEEALYET